MPDSTNSLLLRLVSDDANAVSDVIAEAPTSQSPSLLVAAALLTRSTEPLSRATDLAVTTRDRQLVALARTYLAGDLDTFDVLVREHLGDHPDHRLASWLAGKPKATLTTTERPTP